MPWAPPTRCARSPGRARMRSTDSRVTTLCISAWEPIRIVSTLRSDAATVSVRETPCQSARTNKKTATTRQMTSTVMPVETFRTRRLRTLYLKGIAIRPPAGARPRC